MKPISPRKAEKEPAEVLADMRPTPVKKAEKELAGAVEAPPMDDGKSKKK